MHSRQLPTVLQDWMKSEKKRLLNFFFSKDNACLNGSISMQTTKNMLGASESEPGTGTIQVKSKGMG